MHVEDNSNPPPIIISSDPVEFSTSFVAWAEKFPTPVMTNNMVWFQVPYWRQLWRQHNISQNTKLQVYNAIIYSVLVYGAEIWFIRRSLPPTHMHAFEFLILRTICSDVSAKHLPLHHSAPCSMVQLRPAITWWPLHQRHLPVWPTICRLAMTFDQLEGQCPSGPHAD